MKKTKVITQTYRLKKYIVALVLFTSNLLLNSLCYGALATGNLNVTTSVLGKCQIQSINNLTFPTYDPFSETDTIGTTTMTVRCTNGLSYDVKMGTGTGTGATFATRKMTFNSTNTLNYTLLTATDAIWGDGTSGSSVVTNIGDGNTQTITIKGKIYKAQTSSKVGTYSDTVALTIDNTPP